MSRDRIQRLAEELLVWDWEPESEEGQIEHGGRELFDQPWDEMLERYRRDEPVVTSKEEAPVQDPVKTDKGQVLFKQPWDEMIELRQDETKGKSREHINIDHLKRDTRYYDLQDVAGGVYGKSYEVEPPTATSVEEGEKGKEKLGALRRELERIARSLR